VASFSELRHRLILGATFAVIINTNNVITPAPSRSIGGANESTSVTLRATKLPSSLRQQLAAIEPSYDGALAYFPCDVVLTDGSRVDRVYLVSEITCVKNWGVYPEQDPGKRSVDLKQILSIKDSSFRLPAKFANKLYAQGENGMGYYAFTVVFKSGLRQVYRTGDAVDFIGYPDDLTKEDVVDVLPNTKRDTGYVRGPEYSWCLFSN
jgi:hypothetical protein